MARRRLFGTQPGVSFFAFQDIITAVTGIVILIALIMALQITEPEVTSARAAPDQIALRDALRQQLSALQAKASAGSAEQGGNLADAASIAAEIENLNTLADSLDKETIRLGGESSNMELPGEIEADLGTIRTENERAASELAAIEKRTQELIAAIDAARAKVERAEQTVLAQMEKTNDLWLIPEKSNTSKEPVIVSVLADHFLVQPVDAKQPQQVKRTGNLNQDIEDLLQAFKPTDQYIVFYFRPSTLQSYDAVTAAAKERGFEIGYDLVEEGAAVQFAQPPGEAADAAPAVQPEATPAISDDQPIDIAKELEARGEPKGNGSGFFITKDGHFITNKHVIAEGSDFLIACRDGQWRRARKVAVSDELDLALLVIDGGAHEPLPIADSRESKLGATVATIGFPNTVMQGFSPKLAKGDIASLAGFRDDPNEFQVSVPTQPGNSGGPLFDDRGNVVGVITSRLDPSVALEMTGMPSENVNYAVKSEKLLGWIRDLNLPSLTLPAAKTDRHDRFEDVIEEAEKASAMIVVF